MSRTTADPDLERRIQDAIAAVEDGTIPSLGQAADIYKIKRWTLYRRANKTTGPRSEAHRHQLLLTSVEEEVLVDWMKYLGETGHALNKRTIGPKVEAMLQGDRKRKPSKSWVRRFLQRHPDLVLGRGSGLDPKRARAFNKKAVSHYFLLLENFLQEHDIPWDNVYNMDEKGIQLGGGRKGDATKYFFSREDRARYRLRSDDLQLVTIVEVVCADGTSDIKPCFVFPGSTMAEEWFCEDGALIATSENGWTDDFIGQMWFEKQFMPAATERNKSGKPILLIYDGHGSHTTLELIDHARDHNAHLFCFIPHTTHRCQPLDVGVFGPLQRAWSNRCDAIMDETGEGLDLRDVVKEYMAARQVAFTKKNIDSAWKRSGIYPFNPDIFTEKDFAPSFATSIKRHAPASFPSKMPHVADASSDIEFDPSTPFNCEGSEALANDDNLVDGEQIQRAHNQTVPPMINSAESAAHPLPRMQTNHEDAGHDLSDLEDIDYFPSSDCLYISDYTDGATTDEDVEKEASSEEYLQDEAIGATENADTNADFSDSDQGNHDHDFDTLDDIFRIVHVDISQPNAGAPSNNHFILHGRVDDAVDSISSGASTPAVSTPTPSHGINRILRTRSGTQTPILATPTAAPPLSKKVSGKQKMRDLEAENRRLQDELDAVTAQRDSAEIHAIFALREASTVRYKLENKTKKKEAQTRRIITSARVLTTDEGRAEIAADRAVRDDKKKKEEERQNAKLVAANENQRRRATEGHKMIFSGALPTKKKPELEDMAYSLGLSIDGLKRDIIDRIQAHFNVNPDLKTNERYIGIFNTRGRKRQLEENPPTEDQNYDEGEEPERSVQRRHMEPSAAIIPALPSNMIAGPSHLTLPEPGSLQIEASHFQPYYGHPQYNQHQAFDAHQYFPYGAYPHPPPN